MNTPGTIKSHLASLGRDRFGWAGLCFVCAALALIAPLRTGNTLEHIGALLIVVGIIEILDGFKRIEGIAILMARVSGALSLLMATVLINAPLFQREALYIIVIGVFVLDGFLYLFNFFKAYRNKKIN